MTSKEPFNWVAERGKCDLDSQYEELYLAVKTDVAAMNMLPQRKRRNYLFDIQNGNELGTQFKVVRCEGSNFNKPQVSGVTFEKSEQAIIVRSKYYLADEMVIVPAWDETTSSCRMYVNKDCFEIQKRACRSPAGAMGQQEYAFRAFFGGVDNKLLYCDITRFLHEYGECL